MKSLAVTSTAGTAYTAAQVYSVLCASGVDTFRYEWLGPDGHQCQDITAWVVPTPTITHDSTAAVKRTITMTFDLGTTGGGAWPEQINLYTDLFKVYYRIQAPDSTLAAPSWLEWEVGTFVYSSNTVTHYPWGDQAAWTGADVGQIFVLDQFQQTTAFNAGANVVQACGSIIQGLQGPVDAQMSIPDLGQALGASISWNAGTSKLQALGDLLTAGNYYTPWFDGLTGRSRPIPDINGVLPSWTWNTLTGQSVITQTPSLEDEDRTTGANTVIVVGQAPTATTSATTTTTTPAAAPQATYVNDRSDSPISTANWFTVVAVINDSTVTDVATARIRARVDAQALARVYAAFSVYSLVFPVFEDHDFFELVYSNPTAGTVDEVYEMLGWTMQCGSGLEMTLNMQRVVPA